MSFFLVLAVISPVQSYPQFQMFAEKHSGRTINCALCHVNDSGPAGTGPGQIGSLNAEEMIRLNVARAAMEPGADVNSPILNEFGNSIIKTIGRKKLLQLLSDPSQLAVALGNKSDIDGDGIPDSREYLDGTNPMNRFHGDPWLLFIINLSRYKLHITLALVAVTMLSYGLTNLLKGFSLLLDRKNKIK